MAIRTAAIATPVVRPAISIMRRARANSAACSGVGSGMAALVIAATLEVRTFAIGCFGTGHGQKREAGSHRRGHRGIAPARPRARQPPERVIAVAAESPDSR